MKNKFKLMTISEFAKFHNINTRTLHYYDDIKLFSPICVGKNSYRYYSLEQSVELEIILMFRELGFSISDIKTYLDNCNNNKFLEIAENKLDYINNEIDKLNKLKNILEHKKKNLKLASNLKLIGNAYEIGLNDFAITQIDEYVTKIIIKIDEK